MAEDNAPTVLSDGLPTEEPTVEPTVEPAPSRSPRQEGTELVDFNKLPPDIRPEFEKRFNNLYYQVKNHQRERESELKYYQALDAKLDNFINSTNENKTQEKIELMAEKAKSLFADKRFDEAIELTRKVAEMSAEAAVSSAKNTKQEATDKNKSFTPEEENYLAQFITATPWAQFDSPHHNKTKEVLSQLLAANMSMRDAVDTTKSILGGLIEGMETVEPAPTPVPTPKQHPVVQAVLGQNLSMPNVKGKNVVLDELRMVHARKMFPRLKPADAYVKYQKGMQLD